MLLLFLIISKTLQNQLILNKEDFQFLKIKELYHKKIKNLENLINLQNLLK